MLQSTQINAPRASSFPSLGELRAAIPKHCFEADGLRATCYVLKDFAIIGALFYCACEFIPLLHPPLRELAWIGYWLAQGTMFWALFVLGHDAGHGAAGKSRFINDAVGVLVHSVILLPYVSFQLTHRNHHLNCAHFVKDEGYGPMDENCPIDRRARLLLTMPFVTYWLYMMGLSRQGTNHFSPYSRAFVRDRVGVAWSLAAIAVVLSCATMFAIAYGVKAVVAYYGVPLLVYGCYFMMVTFEQHNDVDMPWYGDRDWTFVKGALSSVDRDFGPLNSFVHHIGTHQIHHLFPSIPHYRLNEATAHFEAKFPELRRRAGGVPFLSYARNVSNYIRFGDVPSGEHTFVYSKMAQRSPERKLSARA